MRIIISSIHITLIVENLSQHLHTHDFLWIFNEFPWILNLRFPNYLLWLRILNLRFLHMPAGPLMSLFWFSFVSTLYSHANSNCLVLTYYYYYIIWINPNLISFKTWPPIKRIMESRLWIFILFLTMRIKVQSGDKLWGHWYLLSIPVFTLTNGIISLKSYFSFVIFWNNPPSQAPRRTQSRNRRRFISRDGYTFLLKLCYKLLCKQHHEMLL